jgi:hypothetical protein
MYSGLSFLANPERRAQRQPDLHFRMQRHAPYTAFCRFCLLRHAADRLRNILPEFTKIYECFLKKPTAKKRGSKINPRKQHRF